MMKRKWYAMATFDEAFGGALLSLISLSPR